MKKGHKLYSTTFGDCYSPHCKSASRYYGSKSSCSMYSWIKFPSNDKYSGCFPKSDSYKERNLGYRASNIDENFYVGIHECKEHNLSDDWCGDCNNIYGKNNYIQDTKDFHELCY